MPERLRTRTEEVTSRQLEVARLVAEGRTNPEIATTLGITLDGAKYHVSELLGRLGLERREEIADWYRTERRGRRGRHFAALFASAPKAFATAAAVTAVAAVGVLFAVGLSGGRAEDAPTLVSPTPVATTVTEGVSAPPVGAVGDATNVPPGLESLPVTLAQRLRSDTLPTVVSWERVDWFDGCFEIPPEGGCPLSVSPVPGYRVVMDHQGGQYVAHTALEARRYALATAPPIAPFEVAFKWTGLHSDAGFLCLDLLLAADGTGSIASCGEAPTPVVLESSRVGSLDTLDFLRSKASYEVPAQARPGAGHVVVSGTVVEAPGSLPWAAERWGRYAAVEAYTGQDSAPIAVGIHWRDDTAEGCAEVQVMQFGVAHISRCPDGADETVYLDDDQLFVLVGWLDAYDSFERSDGDARLTFTSRDAIGVNLWDPIEREMWAWIAAIAAEGAPGPTASE